MSSFGEYVKWIASRCAPVIASEYKRIYKSVYDQDKTSADGDRSGVITGKFHKTIKEGQNGLNYWDDHPQDRKAILKDLTRALELSPDEIMRNLTQSLLVDIAHKYNNHDEVLEWKFDFQNDDIVYELLLATQKFLLRNPLVMNADISDPVQRAANLQLFETNILQACENTIRNLCPMATIFALAYCPPKPSYNHASLETHHIQSELQETRNRLTQVQVLLDQMRSKQDESQTRAQFEKQSLLDEIGKLKLQLESQDVLFKTIDGQRKAQDEPVRLRRAIETRQNLTGVRPLFEEQNVRSSNVRTSETTRPEPRKAQVESKQADSKQFDMRRRQIERQQVEDQEYDYPEVEVERQEDQRRKDQRQEVERLEDENPERQEDEGENWEDLEFAFSDKSRSKQKNSELKKPELTKIEDRSRLQDATRETKKKSVREDELKQPSRPKNENFQNKELDDAVNTDVPDMPAVNKVPTVTKVTPPAKPTQPKIEAKHPDFVREDESEDDEFDALAHEIASSKPQTSTQRDLNEDNYPDQDHESM